LIALLSLEFGDEAVMAGWTAAFTIAVFPGTSGAMIVGLYWGGLCLSRLCAPFLLARAAKLLVVLVASTLAGLAIIAMALAPSTSVLAVAVFIAGLAVGPLAPTIVSVAGDRYPRQMGAAIGLLLSIAQTGGMLLPWLTGRATFAYGYRAGLIVPALAAFGVAAGTVLAWQARARRVGVLAEAPAK
jgi:fucose permease